MKKESIQTRNRKPGGKNKKKTKDSDVNVTVPYPGAMAMNNPMGLPSHLNKDEMNSHITNVSLYSNPTSHIIQNLNKQPDYYHSIRNSFGQAISSGGHHLISPSSTLPSSTSHHLMAPSSTLPSSTSHHLMTPSSTLPSSTSHHLLSPSSTTPTLSVLNTAHNSVKLETDFLNQAEQK